MSYSAAERTNIAEVWSRVAEYFAPFDVDVTTEQPADSDLIKSNSDDPRFGVRVVITPDNPRGAGGMAALNSFGDPTLAPAYCYCANYFTVDQALIIAHEVGHTLGLDHDGDSTHEYYGGQGSWAPIMGCGYGKPVQQWSKGEYDDANNKEDDLAMIARSIPYIADTAPDTRSDAVALTSRQMRGTISSANDSDWYSFDVTSGTLDLSVSGEFGSNGDFAAELWHEGSLVQTVDPAGLAVTHAQLDVDAGAYQLRIFGTGALDVLIDGYSSYGSIGGYTLNVNDVVVLNEPSDISVSTSRTAAAVGESITFTASSTANPAFVGANLAWEFSDGTTTTGAAVSRQMSSASLTATVTMTDASGERTSDPISVRLIKPPVATISMTTNAVKPKVAARFSATAVDPDSQDVTFSWVFSNQTRATGASASATLSTTGTITATVTARNADGATSTATTQVKVTTNSPPAVSASAVASRRAAPATISFDTVAKDPEGTASRTDGSSRKRSSTRSRDLPIGLTTQTRTAPRSSSPMLTACGRQRP